MDEKIPSGVPDPEKMPATKETKDKLFDLMRKLAVQFNKDGAEFHFDAVLPDGREISASIPAGPEQIQEELLDFLISKEVQLEGKPHDLSLHYMLYPDGRLERTVHIEDPKTPGGCRCRISCKVIKKRVAFPGTRRYSAGL
ncbi:MAG: hypothetical protein Q7R62_02465 [bacterium]|nr:hypothetical protein [bacterium]